MLRIFNLSILMVFVITGLTVAESDIQFLRTYPYQDTAHSEIPTLSKQNLIVDDPLVYDTSLFWNAMVDVVIRDSLAYCAMQNGLMILNVADKANPLRVSHLYLEEGWTTDIRLSGDYIYLTEWDRALYIIDVSNPVVPVIAGMYPTPEAAYGIDVADTLAFVVYGRVTIAHGILILNIKDPSNIAFVTDIPVDNPINGMLKVQVAGNYAYVVGDGYLWILDISDPSSPATESKTYTDFYPVDLFVRDTIVYLADLDYFTPATLSAFSIYNVSDVSTPVLLYRDTLYGNVAGVAVSDSIAYVANGEYGMVLYDISDPSNPDSLATFANGGIMGKIEVAGDFAYLVDYWSEAFSIVAPYPVHFQIVNVSDPTDPQLSGGYQFHWKTNNVIYWDGYAYVLSNTNFGLDMIVVDMSSTPDSVGNYQTPGAAEDGFFIEDTLYLAAPYTGLELIDISDPPNPSLIRSYTSLGAFDVQIRDGYAYVACGYAGVRIFDITDPTDAPVASFTLYDFSAEVALYENYLYIADAAGGLFVYDITNPENPIYIDKIGIDQVMYASVYISDNRLYANTQIFDLVANPENPPHLGTIYGFSLFTDLITLGYYAIISDGRNGVKIVNVADPQNIEQIFTYNTPGWANNLAINDNYLIIADYYGLILMKNQIITDMKTDSDLLIPQSFVLYQNSPNPFNPATTIEFDVPHRSDVKIDIFNIIGQKVTTLINETKSAGTYRVEWNGKDHNGIDVSTGIYFYRLGIENYSETRKMLLLK